MLIDNISRKNYDGIGIVSESCDKPGMLSSQLILEIPLVKPELKRIGM